MTSEQKREHWQQHFSAWKDSKLSQRDYCQHHNIKFSTFGYWRKQCFAPTRRKSKFIALPASTASTGLITLTLPNLRLDVPAAELDRVLPIVLRSLREVS
jgi:hypothetical protein